jgi:PD-(D/E)XK nuclease superfamily
VNASQRQCGTVTPTAGLSGTGTSGPAELEIWKERHAEAANAWAALCRQDKDRTSALPSGWTERYQAARSAQQELVRAHLWRGGPQTLLAAIGAQNSELALTAGLAWLLRADGHHGLGPAALSGLLARLGVTGTAGDARIVCEESRGDDQGAGLDRKTRADLVVYGDGWTIVIEAKVFAVEQDGQLDRLHHHWKGEASPYFAFLTRGARDPVSADDSRAHWHRLTWEEIARLVRTAASEQPKAAAGVHDYAETLEAFHRA